VDHSLDGGKSLPEAEPRREDHEPVGAPFPNEVVDLVVGRIADRATHDEQEVEPARAARLLEATAKLGLVATGEVV
jgi:hypothetical protein